MSDQPEFRLRPGQVEWRAIEGEVVALDLKAAEYLGVNPSGAVLWPLLAHGAHREELVQALTTRFGIDRQRAAEDVEAFLAVLREKDLLDR